MAFFTELRGDLFCPNVTGSFAVKRDNMGETILWATGGAFSQDAPTGSTNTLAYSSTGNWVINHFNAHNSNAIYTSGGLVRPLGLALNYIIRT